MTERPRGRNRFPRYDLPLPKLCHLDLDDSVVEERAIFVIGDVHGCYDELQELLDNAREAEHNVLFIFVGDLVNRGPDSVKVVRLLRTSGFYSVRGNHEETTLREYFRLAKDSSYSLPERYEYVRWLDADDIEYLKELPYTISIPSLSVIIVHAGLEQGFELEEQSLSHMTHMRSLIPGQREGDTYSENIPTNKLSLGVPWASLWKGPEHIYFGHDKVRGFQAYKYATGLDSYCCGGGELTGVFINRRGKKLSVPARKVYWVDPDD